MAHQQAPIIDVLEHMSMASTAQPPPATDTQNNPNSDSAPVEIPYKLKPKLTIYRHLNFSPLHLFLGALSRAMVIASKLLSPSLTKSLSQLSNLQSTESKLSR